MRRVPGGGPRARPGRRAVRYSAQILHDPDAERAWNVPGTPFVVVLDDAGVVRAKGTVNNLEQVEGLLDTARHRIEEAA